MGDSYFDHYYHCLTCNLGKGEVVDKFSICSICIIKCHANHDVKYVQFGHYSCDCGKRGEEPCQALKSKGTMNFPIIVELDI